MQKKKSHAGGEACIEPRPLTENPTADAAGRVTGNGGCDTTTYTTKTRMIGFDADNTVIAREMAVLEQALTTDPKMERALRKLIKRVIMQARTEVVGDVHDALKNDPRNAARAVRTAVYKKVLGANINIFSSKKAHGSTGYEPPRKGSTGRGGNRRPRNGRTAQIMGYGALDRGFILRWVNEGMTRTNPRTIKFAPKGNRKEDKWNHHPNTGNRGVIEGRHFFRSAADRELAKAVDRLAVMIEEEFGKVMGGTPDR